MDTAVVRLFCCHDEIPDKDVKATKRPKKRCIDEKKNQREKQHTFQSICLHFCFFWRELKNQGNSFPFACNETCIALWLEVKKQVPLKKSNFISTSSCYTILWLKQLYESNRPLKICMSILGNFIELNVKEWSRRSVERFVTWIRL